MLFVNNLLLFVRPTFTLDDKYFISVFTNQIAPVILYTALNSVICDSISLFLILVTNISLIVSPNFSIGFVAFFIPIECPLIFFCIGQLLVFLRGQPISGSIRILVIWILIGARRFYRFVFELRKPWKQVSDVFQFPLIGFAFFDERTLFFAKIEPLFSGGFCRSFFLSSDSTIHRSRASS